jgi:hypothetical protein
VLRNANDRRSAPDWIGLGLASLAREFEEDILDVGHDFKI